MRPVDLPNVRTALARAPAVRDAAAWITPGGPRTISALQRGLQDATLFWVTAEMTDLSIDVAEHEIAEARWRENDRPAPAGLLVSEDRVGRLASTEPPGPERTVLSATGWAPHPDGILLHSWVERSAITSRYGKHSVPRHAPPLVGIGGCVLPVTDDYQTLETLPAQSRKPVALLQAMWLLMEMPGITTSESTLPAPRAGSTHATRRDHTGSSTAADQAVTIIQIRRRPFTCGATRIRRWSRMPGPQACQRLCGRTSHR